MTLPEIIDAIISQVQSTRTVQSKFSVPYMIDVVNSAKGTVQNLLYKKYQKINSAWTQQYRVEYVKDTQETNKFVRFALPTPAVTLGMVHSGIVYAGNPDGCQNYALVQSRGELSTFLSHRTTKNIPIILYSDTYLEVYNLPLIKEMLIDYVPADPTLLPTYNFDIDQYPLDEEGIALLKDSVYNTITLGQSKAPVDYSNSMVDKPTETPHTE
jgi:hypothetical protein